MPYITQERRGELIDGDIAETPGELNYLFTIAALAYLDHHGLSYHVINDILGALEGAKMEFYRRMAVPYEDIKRHENGDVY